MSQIIAPLFNCRFQSLTQDYVNQVWFNLDRSQIEPGSFWESESFPWQVRCYSITCSCVQWTSFSLDKFSLDKFYLLVCTAGRVLSPRYTHNQVFSLTISFICSCVQHKLTSFSFNISLVHKLTWPAFEQASLSRENVSRKTWTCQDGLKPL